MKVMLENKPATIEIGKFLLHDYGPSFMDEKCIMEAVTFGTKKNPRKP